MEDDKRKLKTKRRFPRKRLTAAAVLLAIAFFVCLSVQYLSFVSKTVYEESTAHLDEILHKSNSMLSMIANKNISYLHLWNGFLDSNPDDAGTQAYLESAQKELGFAGFYFLSYDGNYMTPGGETGYLGLQSNLDELLADQDDVVMNAALPGQDPMLVFICPETKGVYRGFAYDAIAISRYNADVMKTVDESAFGGAASSYVIYPDGQVVIEDIAEGEESIYNLVAVLRDYSDLTETQMQELVSDFAKGASGNREVTLGGTRYYLVYESAGVQNWIMAGIVPVDVVNAGMNQLWLRTVQIVTGIVLTIAVLIILLVTRWGHVKLRRKDYEILCRDELFQKLSQNVDDVFLMLDAKTYKADYISPNMERLLGLTRESVRENINTLALLHPKDFPDRTKNYLEGLAGGEQREWDMEYVHQKTGERRWFHVVAMGSEVEGQTKYILVLSDRTADRQVNQALSDAVAAAENANRAKSTFLSNMSHDIRTPMNAIIGFTTLAVSHLDDKDRMKEYLTKILASGNHLLSLINDILDMSRIESGKIQLDETEVNLSDVLHDIKTIVSGQIYAKQLDLYMDAMDITDEDVYCDKTRLNQVLMNLLSNAIKFTPAGGTVSVRVRQLAGKVGGCGQYEFRVKDSGIGMSPEFAKKIFEPFERERTSTVSKIQGTGLGMAITKNIVDMMGGTIAIESEPGKGSEFIVDLCFALSGQRVEPRQLPQLEGLRALVADDDTDTCLSVSTMLSKIGMRPEWTISGREAVIRTRYAMEQGDEFSVYIIDWLIPDMNGIEVVRQIRKVIGKSCPIIILTAYDWTDIEEEARAAGVTAFCEKPLFLSELRRVLAEPYGAEPACKPAQPAAAELKGKKLLLVEDNALNRELALEILKEAGFTVDTAEDGEIAVQKMKQAAPGQYDLILMDIQMPKMDGYEATRQIRALPDAAKAGIPIFAMTANAFEEDRQSALKAGWTATLQSRWIFRICCKSLQMY